VIDLIGFNIAGHRAAIRTIEVIEVVRAVLPTRVERGPAILEGVINLRGQLAPVFSIAERLGFPSRALDPSDHFVVARAGGRLVALRAEGQVELQQVADNAIERTEAVLTTGAPVAGLARLADGVLLVCDLSAFLAEAEGLAVDAALAAVPA
jgi:purine-binding chemotaxis protein CheW